MNAVQFSGALGKVDGKYVMEAVAYEGKKSGGWLKWSALAACFGLILAAVMITVPGGVTPPPAPDAPGIVVGVDGEPSGAAPVEPPRKQRVVVNWDNVAVNESAGMAPDAALRYYDPELYAEETWGEPETVAYYGWNLAPAYIPEGLSGGGQGVRTGVVRERATGEIVQEQAGRSFWTDFREDGSPKSDDDIYIPTGFTVRASKRGILHCALLPVDESKTTDFGGVPVTLSHCALPYGPFDPTRRDPSGLYNMPAGYYDIYVASFTLNGAEYEIAAQRLELEEVIQITASVINMPRSEKFTVGSEPPALGE